MADISVIIPMYNVKEYIEECLECLLRQGNVSLEVLIIDDGTTDGSDEIAGRFCDTHEGFRYFRVENAGPGNARNYGARLARGKYLAFLDSDDVLVDGTYERMFAMCEREQAEIGLMGTCRFSGKRGWKAGLQETVFDSFSHVTNIRENHAFVYDTFVTNKLILRSFYEKGGFTFPVGIAYEDLPVSMDMHLKADRVAMLDRVGYLWRFRENGERSITQRKTEMKNLSDRLTAVKMIETMAVSADADADLLRHFRIKFLEHDLIMHINMIPLMEKGDACAFLDMIRKAAGGWIKECMSGLRVLSRRKYEFIMNGDYEKASELVKFGKLDYDWLEVRRKAGRRDVMLPKELFGTFSSDFTNDFRFTPMQRRIHQILAEKDRMIISGYVYKPRLEVKAGEQKISARLSDSLGGFDMKVHAKTPGFRFLTTYKGTVYSPHDDRLFEYDYDGASFMIELDESTLSDVPDGRYSILLDYENDVRSGTVMLDGFSEFRKKRLDGFSSLIGTRLVTVRIEAFDQLILEIKEAGSFVKDVSADSGRVLIRLSEGGNLTLKAGGTAGDAVCLETEDGSLGVDASLSEKLTPKTVYTLLDKNGGDVPSPFTRNVTVNTDSGIVFISFRDGKNTLILKEESYASVEEIKKEGDVLVLGLLIKGKASDGPVTLYVDDGLRKERKVLSEGRVKDGRVHFEMDFADSDFTKDLYASKRALRVAFGEDSLYVHDTDGKIKGLPAVKSGTLEVEVSDGVLGRTSLRFRQAWPKKQNRARKRIRVAFENRKELEKQNIRKKRIFVQTRGESGGKAFKAAEKLKKKFPDIEIVLAVDDIRLPFEEKRVRKNSLSHFRAMYSSAFIITDMELSPVYRKREDQTWILIGDAEYTRADRTLTGDISHITKELERIISPEISGKNSFIKRIKGKFRVK